MLNFFQKLDNSVEPDSKDLSNNDLHDWLGKSDVAAVVDEAISGPKSKGRVYFRGSWWPAKCEQAVCLEPGVQVKVVGMDKITLLVEPVSVDSGSVV